MDARIKQFIKSVGATEEDFVALDLHVSLVRYAQDESGRAGGFVPLVTRGSGLEVQVVGVGVVKAMVLRRHVEQKQKAQKALSDSIRYMGRYEYTTEDFEGGSTEASLLGWEVGSTPPVFIGVGGLAYKYVKQIMDASNEDCLGWEYAAVERQAAVYKIIKVWND